MYVQKAISSTSSISSYQLTCSREVELTEDQEDSIDQEEVQDRWWHKLEPLASVFRKACLDSWLPSTHVAVDEMMIRCSGRSKHTYKMPSNPIAQGYKIFAICDGGYLLYFIWTSRSRKMSEVK